MTGYLLSTVDAPDAPVAVRLRNLLKRFPDSSDAPYARFALARHLAVDPSGEGRRVRCATAADELE